MKEVDIGSKTSNNKTKGMREVQGNAFQEEGVRCRQDRDSKDKIVARESSQAGIEIGQQNAKIQHPVR